NSKSRLMVGTSALLRWMFWDLAFEHKADRRGMSNRGESTMSPGRTPSAATQGRILRSGVYPLRPPGRKLRGFLPCRGPLGTDPFKITEPTALVSRVRFTHDLGGLRTGRSVMPEITHHFVKTNGIKMHVAESGQGPPVVMCHGFPELWYSWRH